MRRRRALAGVSALALAALCACSSSGAPPPAPEGWRLAYVQDFEGDPGLDFVVSDPAAWRVAQEDGNRFLELCAPSGYAPPHRSPPSLAVLAGPYVGDFVLEVHVQQAGPASAQRDACVLFGLRDPAHFLCAQLAGEASDAAHHVLIVDGHDGAPVTLRRSFGVDWVEGAWHRVRVERDTALERVRVWLDDRPWPVLEARSGALQDGWIGLGTAGVGVRFDDLRLWAPEFDVRSPPFFQPLADRR